MKISKNKAFTLAKSASAITMTDNTLGWNNRVITRSDMISEIKHFALGWYAHQEGNIISVDILGGITFTITL